MGIENLIEEGIGAFAADKGLEAIDPNAGILAKGIAALAGGEGVNLLKEVLGGEHASEHAPEHAAAEQSDDEASASDGSDEQQDS